MRILIVNRHYGNEHVPTGRMLADVALALVASGHDVSVLTSRSSYSVTCEAVTATTEIKVRYVWSVGERYRLFSWVLFLVQAWVSAPFMRWDRCLLLTDPPFLATLSILLRPFPKIHSGLLWWTMDLYPEILVGSGRLKESSRLNALLRRLNAEVIRRMGGFILLGDCQLERMRAYPTWQDRDFVIVPPWDRRPIEKVERDNNRFLEKYDLKGKKVALYAGNLGEGHTFDSLVNAARVLAEAQRNDWVIVFAIRGSKKQQLIDASKDLPSILILNYQPVDWTSDLLWSADVHLITMNGQSRGLVVPSKLYGVLQTEAPVLFIGPKDADTAKEIERYRAGATLAETCSGADVLAALDRLYSRTAIGSSARIPPDTTGPDRIAGFVTQERNWVGADTKSW